MAKDHGRLCPRWIMRGDRLGVEMLEDHAAEHLEREVERLKGAPVGVDRGFQYGSSRIGNAVRMVLSPVGQGSHALPYRENTGRGARSPFRPYLPDCPEAVSSRAMGRFPGRAKAWSTTTPHFRTCLW